MQIHDLNLPQLCDVACRMRAIDRQEIFATQYDDDPARLAAEIMRCGGLGGIALLDDGTPAAAVGAIPVWPRFWSVWMFATDDWPRIARGFGRWVRGTLKPQLYRAGCRRAECHSLDIHHDAHRWMEFLGMRREAVAPFYGKDGETFYVYAWHPGIEPAFNPDDGADSHAPKF